MDTYKDFRPRLIFNTVLSAFVLGIGLVALNVINVSINFGSGIDAQSLSFLLSNVEFQLPVLLIGAIYMYLRFAPLHAAFLKTSRVATLAADEDKTARGILRSIQRIILTVNLCAFLIPSIVNHIMMPHEMFSFFVIINILYDALAGVLISYVQVSWAHRLLEKPRRTMKIFSMDESEMKDETFNALDGRVGRSKTHENGIKRRMLSLSVSIVGFVMIVLLSQSMTMIRKETTYSGYLEKITKNELSREDAEAGYQKDISAFAGIPPTVVVFPLDKTTSDVKNGRILSVEAILFLALLAVAFWMQSSFANEIVGQVTGLRKRVEELLAGSGDLTARIEIVRFDEVGLLTDRINKLMESLRGIFLKVRQTGKAVGESSIELKRQLQSTTAATEEMIASINQVSSNTQRELPVVSSTKASVGEIIDSLDSITESVNSQATFVDQTSSAINEMAANIQSVTQVTQKASDLSEGLVQVALEGGQAVNTSISAIRDIEESSKQVNDIVVVIAKIANQTNLLAMNAAIEAAHAGEAGRGFAVVAEEVRNLAENSAKSAKEITVHIKGMMGKVNNGVKLSENAGLALKRISDDIQSTTNLVREIANAMSEQNMAAKEILSAITSLVNETQSIKETARVQKDKNAAMRESIQKITDAFSEIALATKEQVIGNDEIVKAVNNLSRIADENDERVVALRALVDGFKLEA
jgi:methyl-accepting chemotaxis protein